MQGSWRIARVAGIDISIHWTFVLLLLWVLGTSLADAGMGQGLIDVAFVLSLFGCVVLHELGHATAARVFGIPTHGITLLPIGGVAQLDRIPRDPWQEWIIALAGPAVNVMIVGILFPIIAAVHGFSGLDGFGGWASSLAFGESFLTRLIWMNVMLVAFNLIPAFPMDGGRVLRSFLAQRSDYISATRSAKRVGQGVAVLLAVLGLWTNPMLLMIAAFVIYAAESEYRAVLQEGTTDVAREPSKPDETTTLGWPWPRPVPLVTSSPDGDVPPAASSPRSEYLRRLPDGVILIRTLPAHGHRLQHGR